MTLSLKSLQPFAKGGNRLCFVHPEQNDRCIKIRRPDFTLKDLRRSKGFPKNLKPISSFDDNLEEYRVLKRIKRSKGDKAFEHISRCYGFTPTDMGKGLVLELIRDGDGKISYSLKQYLIEHNINSSLEKAIDDFCSFWEQQAIPSRNLLLHNIVVQRNKNGDVKRLVIIDGLGSPNIIPSDWLPLRYQHLKASQKTADLRHKVQDLLNQIKTGKQFSEVGKLLHDGTEI